MDSMIVKKILFFILLLVVPIATTQANVFGQKEPGVNVQNRILAKVNGNNISVVDVMKKMDVYLARAYPGSRLTPTQKQEFYETNWQHTLTKMIDNILIIADAEKLELKISDADIREKIHERFGPNVMASLDELGITLDEAKDMIHSEMTVQRMSWHRIYSKAMFRVGPSAIKVAYQDFLVQNPPKEEWKYQVLSIRAVSEKVGVVFAQKAQALIRNEPLPFEDLAKLLQEDYADDKSITIKVSDEYNVDGASISETHKAVLCNLQPGNYSELISQVSRRDNSHVHRIFHLKDYKVTPAPKFDSKVDDLHDELVQKEIEKEFPAYLAKLRDKFNFDESQLDALPKDFQPFTLQ